MKRSLLASRHLWALIGSGILLVAAGARVPVRLTAQPIPRSVPDESHATTVVAGVMPATGPESNDALTMPGTVEGTTSEIRPAIDGVVSQVKCRLGQAVKKGDVLIQLDDTVARAELAAAEAYAEDARAKAEALDSAGEGAVPPSMKRAAIAEQKFAAAQIVVRQAALGEMQINAPIDGVVTRFDANPGDVVNRGTSLGAVVQLDRVNVSVDVAQAVYPSLRVGQDAEIRSTVLRAQRATGNVSFISPQFDPFTGTALVKVAVANSRGELKPGMSVSVQILVSRPATEPSRL